MNKLLIAAMLMIGAAMPARATCPSFLILPTGLNLPNPTVSSGFDVWADCLFDMVNIVNDSAASTTTASAIHDAIAVSTTSLQAQLDSVAVSTSNLESRLNEVATSTNSLQAQADSAVSRLDEVAVSTDSLQAQVDALSFEVFLDTFSWGSGATKSTGNSIGGIIFSTSAILIFSGTGDLLYNIELSTSIRFNTAGVGITWADGSRTTSAAQGGGGAQLFNDNEWTGFNTYTKFLQVSSDVFVTNDIIAGSTVSGKSFQFGIGTDTFKCVTAIVAGKDMVFCGLNVDPEPNTGGALFKARLQNVSNTPVFVAEYPFSSTGAGFLARNLGSGQSHKLGQQGGDFVSWSLTCSGLPCTYTQNSTNSRKLAHRFINDSSNGPGLRSVEIVAHATQTGAILHLASGPVSGGGLVTVTTFMPSGFIETLGAINTKEEFQVDGVPGISQTCPAGQTLGGPTYSGGIATAGSCITTGGGDAVLAADQDWTGENTFVKGFGSGDPVSAKLRDDEGEWKWMRSRDSVTVATGCAVVWGTHSDGSGDDIDGERVFTSTNVVGERVARVAHAGVVVGIPCAPGEVCRVGTQGIYRVLATAVSNSTCRTSATRCAVQCDTTTLETTWGKMSNGVGGDTSPPVGVPDFKWLSIGYNE